MSVSLTRREVVAAAGSLWGGVLAGRDANSVINSQTRALRSLPRTLVRVDARRTTGRLETWRHGIGQGGVNPAPLSGRTVEAARLLKPRLIRLFIQEFFRIYPAHGRFDWGRLDPYLESFSRTGAKVVAALCIKPRTLYPAVDQRIWRPSDTAEWQSVVTEMVRRYSVHKKIVSHWEILNEPDIGEDGGTPHLIPNPDDYYAFYRMTVEPILKVFPEAKVGGPAATWAGAEPLPGLIERCRESNTRLDFVSWHRYDDDPAAHASGVKEVKKRLEAFPGPRPETMVTEWSKSFDPISIEELAFDTGRAATIASAILAMIDAGLDWSYYYHLQDQFVRANDFEPFMSTAGVQNMVRHWNEVPHRFGLFGVDGRVRPQYFVFWMLGRLNGERIAAEVPDSRLRGLASENSSGLGMILVNWSKADAVDQLASLELAGLRPGSKRLTVYRIDTDKAWTQSAPVLKPNEDRDVESGKEFRCQILCPANSVTLVELADRR